MHSSSKALSTLSPRRLSPFSATVAEFGDSRFSATNCRRNRRREIGDYSRQCGQGLIEWSGANK